MPFTTVFCIFINLGLRETINRAAGALQKDQNGADIP
ncbi:phage tail protein, partial [Salmonella enterica]|nr:phage tail protein [Salmonella enterica]